MRIGEGVAGTLTDFVAVPYDFGTNSILAHLNTSYYHVHGQSFVYPNHADEVLITAGAPAWDLTGTKTEVVPANALDVSAFDLHWINISNISENATIQIPQQLKNERISCRLSSSTTNATTCLVSFEGHYYA
jgi:hypothetical protein